MSTGIRSQPPHARWKCAPHSASRRRPNSYTGMRSPPLGDLDAAEWITRIVDRYDLEPPKAATRIANGIAQRMDSSYASRVVMLRDSTRDGSRTYIHIQHEFC